MAQGRQGVLHFFFYEGEYLLTGFLSRPDGVAECGRHGDIAIEVHHKEEHYGSQRLDLCYDLRLGRTGLSGIKQGQNAVAGTDRTETPAPGIVYEGIIRRPVVIMHLLITPAVIPAPGTAGQDRLVRAQGL